jgi:AraC-like DNA-binding protein
MFLEPTTLTSAALVMTETVEKQYGIDTKPLLEKLGLDPALMERAGARYPTAKMRQLWGLLAEATGDPCVGLAIGAQVKTTSFHALGFAWLASSSIFEELQRLQRYFKVISNVPIDIQLIDTGSTYRFEMRNPEIDEQGPPESVDAFFMAIIKLCRITRDNHFSPTRVGLVVQHKENHLSRYVDAFSAPVEMGAAVDYIEFDKAECDAILPGKNIDLAIANERVLDNYVQALDPDKVSTQVKELLIALMPSGHASQDDVARRMNRSLSTLQRQLSSEGKNFKDIRDETRRSMAEQYIEEGEYSLSQIAFLLGFSDQSNFSRAFKRWTGTTPGEYRPNSITLQS